MIAQPDNKLRCAIHLGMPKSATSHLQKTLFACHSEVEYLGKFANLRVRRRRPGAKFQALLKDSPTASPEGCRRELEEPLRKARQTGKLVVYSAEGLTGGTEEGHRRRAEIIRDQLGDCRVLITLRHPLRFVESIYFQHLRASALVLPEFHEAFGRLGRSPCYFDVNELLDANSQRQGPIFSLILNLLRQPESMRKSSESTILALVSRKSLRRTPRTS